MNRPKHSSSAVHRYQHEQFPLQSKACADLEPVVTWGLMENLKTEFESKSNQRPRQEGASNTTEATSMLDTELRDSKLMPSADENTLVLHIPVSVKKMVIISVGGKKFAMEL